MTTETIVLPSSINAESAALCCIIENPKRFTASAWEAQIEDEFFYDEANLALWKILSTRIRDGLPVDPSTISDIIQDQKPRGLGVKRFSDILLTEYSEDAWHGYIETLKDRYIRRLAITTGTRVAEENSTAEEATQALKAAFDRATETLANSSAVMDAKSCVMAFAQAVLERQAAGEMPGASTGVTQIDGITGGIRPGELWVVGGPTSSGKSVLMCQMAMPSIMENKRVLVFSLEMGVEEVIGRMISCQYRIPISDIMNPRHVKMVSSPKINRAAKELSESSLMICDKADLTMDLISGYCQRIADKGKIDLILIDYLQLVSSPRIKGQNREQEVAAISRGCKQLAKRMKCPVITGTQLNEQGKSRESRAIEQDADVVMLIEPGKDGQNINFWKVRNGKRGTDVRASLDGEHQRFSFF